MWLVQLSSISHIISKADTSHYDTLNKQGLSLNRRVMGAW